MYVGTDKKWRKRAVAAAAANSSDEDWRLPPRRRRRRQRPRRKKPAGWWIHNTTTAALLLAATRSTAERVFFGLPLSPRSRGLSAQGLLLQNNSLCPSFVLRTLLKPRGTLWCADWGAAP